MNVSVLAVIFRRQLKKPDNFAWNCWVFENCRQNTWDNMETFKESELRLNFVLHFTSYLSMALSKILLHLKTIKNAKKLSLFGESDSCRLPNFLQTLIFWKFDHIYRMYNQVNYRNIWFVKIIIILTMTAEVLFSMFFPKKTRTLMPLRFYVVSFVGFICNFV